MQTASPQVTARCLASDHAATDERRRKTSSTVSVMMNGMTNSTAWVMTSGVPNITDTAIDVTAAASIARLMFAFIKSPSVSRGLTKKAEPPPTRDVNRDSGTDSANGGWLRRLVRHHGHTNGGCTPCECAPCD